MLLITPTSTSRSPVSFLSYAAASLGIAYLGLVKLPQWKLEASIENDRVAKANRIGWDRLFSINGSPDSVENKYKEYSAASLNNLLENYAPYQQTNHHENETLIPTELYERNIRSIDCSTAAGQQGNLAEMMRCVEIRQLLKSRVDDLKRTK